MNTFFFQSRPGFEKKDPHLTPKDPKKGSPWISQNSGRPGSRAKKSVPPAPPYVGIV